MKIVVYDPAKLENLKANHNESTFNDTAAPVVYAPAKLTISKAKLKRTPKHL